MKRKEIDRLARNVADGLTSVHEMRALGQIAERDLARIEKAAGWVAREDAREAAKSPRKRIAEDLSVAAGRAETFERRPATSKQIAYLASLLAAKGLDAEAINFGLTNTQALLTCEKACELISAYKTERTV